MQVNEEYTGSVSSFPAVYIFTVTAGMSGLAEKILQASLPSYDLSIGEDLISNSTTNVSSEEILFQVSRLKAAEAYKDKLKIDTVLCHLPHFRPTSAKFVTLARAVFICESCSKIHFLDLDEKMYEAMQG